MKHFFAIFVFTLCAFAQRPLQMSGKVSATGQFIGQPTGVVSVTVTPANQTINVPQTIGYTATATFSNGSPPQNVTVQSTWSSSNGSVAALISLTTTQNVQCLLSGTVTITATYKGVSGNTQLTCVGGPPPSRMDTYCSAGNIPSFGTNDQYAALPQTCFYTDPSVMTPTGTVHTITASNPDSQWDAAWAAASCGDIIEVQAGAVFTNHHNLPSKVCDSTHYIWLRSSGYASLPPYGTKVTPCYAGVASLPGRPAFNCVNTNNVMFKMLQPGATPAINFTGPVSSLRITGMEITRVTGTGFVQKLIDMNNGDTINTQRIVFDHNWFHGSATGDDTEFAVSFDDGNYIAAIDNFTSDFTCNSVGGACTDSHTFAGGNDSNAANTDATWKIVDNYIEASGENILFGGAHSSITPSDIEIRLNYFFKPLTWNPSDPSYAGQPFIVKNIFEVKNGQRILFEGNVLANNWGGYTQSGRAVELSATNQGGNAPGALTKNITFRFNYVSTMSEDVGKTIRSGGGTNYPAGTNSLSVHDNVFDNMYYSTCFGCQAGPITRDTTNPAAPLGVKLFNVYEGHNTYVLSPTATLQNGTLGISGPTSTSGNQMTNLTWQNNLALKAGNGISNPLAGCSQLPPNCACGQPTNAGVMNACFAAYVFDYNAFIANGGVSWPGTHNCLSEPSYSSIFVNYNNGIMIPGGDFHVKATSPCHNAASDGTDPGANIDTLLNTIQGVTQF